MWTKSVPERPEDWEERCAFRNRLREFRRKYGLSQEEVAEALGMHRITIGNLEVCRNPVFPRAVEKMKALEARYQKVVEAEVEELTGTA